MHVKKTDSYGEDGDFRAKAGVIEEFDSLLPEITELGVDVLAVTGDHSTPSAMKAHSWHSGASYDQFEILQGTGVSGFSESSCLSGDLGIIKATEIMPLLLATRGGFASLALEIYPLRDIFYAPTSGPKCGTGRRAILRGSALRACGFDSRLQHHHKILTTLNH